MSDLTITRALPNPAGKDRTPANTVTNQQLNGEWIEFANSSQRILPMDGVTLDHFTFTGTCTKTGEDRLMVFNGLLLPGNSVRVHTGSGAPWDEGSIRHLYAERGNFAWNNRCGDAGVIRNNGGAVVDWAAYDANPPEGAVLNRLPGTNTLTVAFSRSA